MSGNEVMIYIYDDMTFYDYICDTALVIGVTLNCFSGHNDVKDDF